MFSTGQRKILRGSSAEVLLHHEVRSARHTSVNQEQKISVFLVTPGLTTCGKLYELLLVEGITSLSF